MSRSFGFAASVVIALLALPAVADAQPAMTWNPIYSGNYRQSSGRTIDMIVIHKAEGSLDSVVSWFKNPAAKVSAHYVVNDNQIVHMVQDQNLCWHAGNTAYNNRSIGIENSGYNDRDDFTDAHYRELASLTAYLCQLHGIPIDRKHIIGHGEVPNPKHPGQFGGINGHTCPGPYFKWALFMSYVSQAAGGTAPAPAPTPAPAPAPAPTPAPAPAPSSGGTQAVSVTVASLNVRDGANGNVIGSAPQDTAWVLTGNEEQGFVQVYFRGGLGWLSSQYTTGYSGPGARVTVANLNVRDGASTSSSVVGQADAGQTYSEGAVSGSWVAIRFDENRRWVYQAYTVEVALNP